MATVAELTNQKNKLQGELALFNRNAQLAREDGDTASALRWDQQKLAADAQIRQLNSQILDAANSAPPPAPADFRVTQSNQTATQKKSDDDSPQQPAKAATVTQGGGGTTTAADSRNLSAVPPPQTTGGGTTTQGKANLPPTSTGDNEYPITKLGARQYNPLAKLSSYTYQISLYMLNGDAYNSYIQQGPSSLANNNGVRIVAQSGGVNNAPRSATTDVVGIKRAAGFEYDYYIDNLKFTTNTPAKAEGSTATAKFDFVITEPTGFNFTTLLSQAATEIQSTSKAKTTSAPNQNANGLSQVYLLVTRFYGYDAAGALIPNANYTDADTTDNLDRNALFERYYPIYIQNMSFSMGAKAIQYQVKAVLYCQQQAFTPERGVTKENTTVSGATVNDILAGAENSLKVALNKSSLADKERGTFDTSDTFDFNFTNEELKNSKMVVKSPDRTAQTQVADSSQSTVGASQQTKAIATTKLEVAIKAGTPIISLINQILKQSKFAESALPYSMSEGADPTLQSNSSPTELTWWNVTPTVTLKTDKFDDKRNTYAMNITYNISTYKVPYVKSIYTDNTTSYYGPVKKYGYWYTGKNTEIISYEQTFNNLYHLTASVSDSVDRAKSGSYSVIRVSSGGAPNVPDDVGPANKGGAIINNVETVLFSPGDLTKAKMTILGDPDYLDQSLEGSFSSVKSKQTQGKSALSDFYGRNLTVSANSGQVFIEVTFAEGRDYNENGNIPDGLKYINGKIKFWEYPKEIAKKSPNSIIYQVLSVATTFANGKFTQELELVIVNWPNDGKKETTQADSAGRPTENSQSQATPPTTGRPSTNAASLRANINAAAGTTSQPPTVAPPKKTSQPFVEPSAPTLQQTQSDVLRTVTGTQTGVSPTGAGTLPVQDDDAAVQAIKAQPALSYAGAQAGAGRETTTTTVTTPRNTSPQTQVTI
jgi:hypothetical protein